MGMYARLVGARILLVKGNSYRLRIREASLCKADFRSSCSMVFEVDSIKLAVVSGDWIFIVRDGAGVDISCFGITRI